MVTADFLWPRMAAVHELDAATAGFILYLQSWVKQNWQNSIVDLCSIPTPLHLYMEDPTPNTSECGLIWRLGLYRVNQIKMRSLG